MPGRTLLLVGLILGLAPSGAGAVLRVPLDHSRITDALAAASPGDTIEVAPGTYSVSGNGETFPLTLATDEVWLMGAGAGLSIIDADGLATAISITASTGIRVSGFTITHGNGFDGGGVHISAGSPEIDRNFLIGNIARNEGSGIYITGGGNPWIHHNVIWESTDIDVAGFGDPHGIQIKTADGVIEHNLIGRGDSNGLLFQGGSDPQVRNNIFYENGIDSLRGRGVCSFGGPGTVIAHNIFFDNAIASILLGGSGDLTAAEANTLSAVDGIYGNLDADPLLNDPDNQDWMLMGGSPAIDAGDPVSPADPDSTPADIGPFYFDQGSVGVGGPPTLPAIVLSSFPNPFRTGVSLSLVLPDPATVRVSVFDSQGRRIRVLLDAALGPGASLAPWDGRNDAGVPVGAGVYFGLVEINGTPAGIRKLTRIP